MIALTRMVSTVENKSTVTVGTTLQSDILFLLMKPKCQITELIYSQVPLSSVQASYGNLSSVQEFHPHPGNDSKMPVATRNFFLK